MSSQGAWSLSIANTLSAFGEAQRSLEGFLQESGVSPEVLFAAAVTFEEAVTNVIRYAYEDDRNHQIHLEARFARGRLSLRITDDGRPFNPLSAAPPELDKPPEERPVGGLGIHLMRRFAERVKYGRRKGHNVLTLFFRTNADH